MSVPRTPSTLHAFIESEVCFGPINAGQAEAPPPTHGVFNREMIYTFTNFLFGTWMHGEQGSEKGVMRFSDCHLERLTIQQVLNEALGGLPCLKTPLPDNYLLAATHRLPRGEGGSGRASERNSLVYVSASSVIASTKSHDEVYNPRRIRNRQLRLGVESQAWMIGVTSSVV